MRRSHILATLAISAFAVASCASAPSAPTSARSTGSWTFSYDSATGLSTAEQRDADGSVSARVTCQTPSGDMMVTDYRLGGGRGETRARFTIGQETIDVPATSDGRTLTVRLPRRPPNLGSYAHLSRDPVSMSAGGATHAYAADALEKFALVANSCWPTGS
ncbi:MAG: hypothetical protein HXY28_13380 [Hydrogenophilaceae bacterium]|jgi:hypothetical protein|nr:hypothetical protein [Hydrogenophilaceae bacterium]